MTRSDIAARLEIAPRSYVRDELNHALTALRQRGLVKYEHDPDTGEICWRLSGVGRGIATTIQTGVTGWERSAADDRSRDRFIQVRDGTAAPWLEGR